MNRAALQRIRDGEAVEGNSAVIVYRNKVQEVIEEKATVDALEITQYLAGTAPVALKRINEMVQSRDENIATRNAHFIVEQLVGKAKSRNESLNVNVNIDVLAD